MTQTNRNNLPGLKEKRYQQKKDIITFLYKMGELSKPEICRLTNMTTPTISRIIDELIEEGWVVDLGQGASVGGKRPHIFSLAPDAAYILGVDVGRIDVKVAIFNLRKEILGEIKVYPSNLEAGDKDATMAHLKVCVNNALEELNIPKDKLKVAGFSIPGLIDSDGTSYSYLTYENPNIRHVLEKQFNMPIFIANDSKVMAMAEHTFGAAVGVDNALCISVNECIGMGMIINGKPFSGFKGMSGEFGHIRMSGVEEQCYCGKVGCLETIASGRAIVKQATKAISDGENTLIPKFAANGHVTLDAVIEAAKQDDIFAIDLVQKAGEKIGEGVSTLIHLFNPQLVVIGGEIVSCGDMITAPIQQAINKYSIARLRNQCEIKLSPLTSDSTILGSLMVVMKHLYYEEASDNFSLY
ncbi:MAG: ROK family transcriptional regulator [Marinifilaceae bacterium]